MESMQWDDWVKLRGASFVVSWRCGGSVYNFCLAKPFPKRRDRVLRTGTIAVGEVEYENFEQLHWNLVGG